MLTHDYTAYLMLVVTTLDANSLTHIDSLTN